MDATRKKLETEASAQENGGRERRMYPRTGCWGSAWVNILPEGIKVVGYLRNLSLRGCYIETDDAIPSHSGGRVEVLLQFDGFSVRLAGVIRHMEEDSTRIGIEFTEMSPRKAEQVRCLMEAIAEAEKERLAGVKELGG
jgi:hypothetical protein